MYSVINHMQDANVTHNTPVGDCHPPLIAFILDAKYATILQSRLRRAALSPVRLVSSCRVSIDHPRATLTGPPPILHVCLVCETCGWPCIFHATVRLAFFFLSICNNIIVFLLCELECVPVARGSLLSGLVGGFGLCTFICKTGNTVAYFSKCFLPDSDL